MTFRKTIFWLHLIAGLVAGIAIGIMSFTGAALAFEKEIVAFAERDARRVTPPSAEAPRLSLVEMQRRLREAQPEARPTGVTLLNDPHAAVAFPTGRTGAFYVDPYTGEVRQPKSTAVHDFLHVLEDWHRVLAMAGDNRPTGKAINGACNLAFFVLAVTGLYIWMPRSWSWKSVRAIALFNGNVSGKARDFNWHNVIGLWSAPILIVLTLTALPISYRWAGNLIYTLTGTPAPAAPAGAGPGLAAAGPAVEVPTPPAGARPLDNDALLALVLKQTPQWETITLRTGPAVGGRGGQRGGGGATASPRSAETRPANDSSRAAGEIRPSTPQPATFTIRTGTSWPRTATTTLALNPYTGDVLRRTGYADLNAAQKVRSWTRFLHTGEALGWGGQLVAGLACLGGCVLVYTGFALAWRRFFGKSTKPPSSTGETVAPATTSASS
jgi:uncharacterized iron-regulated membrane protein